MIYAKVVADSISPTGSRLTTIEAQFHRFILAEVNTHRAFSRNSASSRAIPTKKLIEQVRNNPAIPVAFGSNQPGMQAGVELSGWRRWVARSAWVGASRIACLVAWAFMKVGLHKQVGNRVLEPFMWHRIIMSSTEEGFENFFNQRISPLAQPEINALAIAIKEAMDASEPSPIEYGEWHLPYTLDIDGTELQRKASAARCARVSYLTHDGIRDLDKDLELYDKLVSADPPHWSPLEHVAAPDGPPYNTDGNFDGWHQLRHLPEYQ